ncbi:hypothetical protein [Paraprevotella xylaniphila]|uniref:hypothetical protein n=1 Tax=Paraprevotella xylaniphila TaxID=454155 RepID=UPI0010328CDB|nr:hypothetical protein [Paraprevotella xylaniphila]
MEQRVGNIRDSNVKNVNIIEGNNDFCDNKRSDIFAKFIYCVNLLLFVANAIVIVFNIYYACHYYPNTRPLEFDYTGIIIGILSILITILVGWQILSNILTKREIKEEVNKNIKTINKHIKLMDEQSRYSIKHVNKSIEDCKCLSIGVSLAQLGISQYYNDDYNNAVRSLFNSLIFLEEIENNDDLKNEAYEKATEVLL